MTIEETVGKSIEDTENQDNATEKTISLQLIGVATFVATVLGAFIVIPGLKPLGMPQKIFLLIDILALFASITFGIIHLLVIKNMYSTARRNAVLTGRIFQQLSDCSEENKVAIFIAINTEINSTMTFFYLQLSCLAVSVAIFLGIIITLLF